MAQVFIKLASNTHLVTEQYTKEELISMITDAQAGVRPSFETIQELNGDEIDLNLTLVVFLKNLINT